MSPARGKPRSRLDRHPHSRYPLPAGTPWDRLRKVTERLDVLSSQEFPAWIEGELQDVIGGGELDEVELWEIDTIYDSLTWLAELVDAALTLTQHRLEDEDVLAKIATLRNTSGRTPAEAETARKLADRLERKLKTRIEATS